jgi:hypothetical protein
MGLHGGVLETQSKSLLPMRATGGGEGGGDKWCVRPEGGGVGSGTENCQEAQYRALRP